MLVVNIKMILNIGNRYILVSLVKLAMLPTCTLLLVRYAVMYLVMCRAMSFICNTVLAMQIISETMRKTILRVLSLGNFTNTDCGRTS